MRHYNILGGIWVTQSNCHNNDPQMLGPTAIYWVTTAI